VPCTSAHSYSVVTHIPFTSSIWTTKTAMSSSNPPIYRSVPQNVQGCRYTEFRGMGHPSNITLAPKPGDIYLNIQSPRAVWVYSGTDWTPWESMADSRSVPHPIDSRILYPNTERFAWVPVTGFAGFKRQVDLLLDGRDDTAHVHVSNILENERNIALAAKKYDSSSEDSGESTSGSNGDEVGCSSSEHSREATPAKDEVNEINDDDVMIVDDKESDDKESDASDRENTQGKWTLEDFRYSMRQSNDYIRRVVDTGPRGFHVIILTCKPTDTSSNRHPTPRVRPPRL
jgi:hypothetical protein